MSSSPGKRGNCLVSAGRQRRCSDAEHFWSQARARSAKRQVTKHPPGCRPRHHHRYRRGCAAAAAARSRCPRHCCCQSSRKTDSSAAAVKPATPSAWHLPLRLLKERQSGLARQVLAFAAAARQKLDDNIASCPRFPHTSCTLRCFAAVGHVARCRHVHEFGCAVGICAAFMQTNNSLSARSAIAAWPHLDHITGSVHVLQQEDGLREGQAVWQVVTNNLHRGLWTHLSFQHGLNGSFTAKHCTIELPLPNDGSPASEGGQSSP